MILHVVRRAQLSQSLDKVVVCTDSYKICDMCVENEIEVVLTKSIHINGTERIAEAVNILNLDKETIIVDIQGDEPLLKPYMIDNVADYLIKNNQFDISPIIDELGKNWKINELSHREKKSNRNQLKMA